MHAETLVGVGDEYDLADLRQSRSSTAASAASRSSAPSAARARARLVDVGLILLPSQSRLGLIARETRKPTAGAVLLACTVRFGPNSNLNAPNDPL